eukprot:jgi/Tetstr1/451409/TSEL_038445.t1
MQRRKFLTASAAGVAGVTLAGCDQFDSLLRPGHPVRDTLASANDLTLAAQRLFLGDEALAKEFAESEIRQGMRPNGTTDPQEADYVALRDNDFADYQLVVDGLVETPQSYSLDQLRNMPSRTQITRHDCVEGWSCIAKWTGVPLALILDETILAYGMNDAALPVRNGAPVRVRIERQLGYKMAKYLRRIELVDDFSQLHRGMGSYWADHGYDWYAGI